MVDTPGFRHLRRPVAAAVGDVAREVWTVDAARCRSAVERALPDTAVELYINLGREGRYIAEATPRPVLPPRAAWVVGARCTPLDIEKEVRDCCVVAIRLQPWSVEPILGVPARELTARMVDLDTCWGREVENLRERLFDTKDPATRLTTLENAVLARSQSARRGSSNPLARSICESLDRGRRTTVGELAADHGLTHRRMIAICDETVGMKPKQFLRVRRLRQALALIEQVPRPAWTTIAYRCGYYDQAHLINEFRELCGMTPLEYASERSSVGRGFVPRRLATIA